MIQGFLFSHSQFLVFPLTIQKLFNMNEIIDENELDGSEW